MDAAQAIPNQLESQGRLEVGNRREGGGGAEEGATQSASRPVAAFVESSYKPLHRHAECLADSANCCHGDRSARVTP